MHAQTERDLLNGRSAAFNKWARRSTEPTHAYLRRSDGKRALRHDDFARRRSSRKQNRVYSLNSCLSMPPMRHWTAEAPIQMSRSSRRQCAIACVDREMPGDTGTIDNTPARGEPERRAKASAAQHNCVAGSLCRAGQSRARVGPEPGVGTQLIRLQLERSGTQWERLERAPPRLYHRPNHHQIK